MPSLQWRPGDGIGITTEQTSNHRLDQKRATLRESPLEARTPETDPTVMVEGPGTRLCFHLRQGERPARNRLHLDISTPDRSSEVQRLLSLGATFVREADGYTVLNDPEGNNFCVVTE